MLSDAQGCKRSSAQQWNGCGKRDDQTITIVHCICDRNFLGGLSLTDDAIHQIGSDPIEDLARHQTMFCLVFFRRAGLLPPKSLCLPLDVFCDDLRVPPTGRRADEQTRITSREKSKEFPVGIL